MLRCTAAPAAAPAPAPAAARAPAATPAPASAPAPAPAPTAAPAPAPALLHPAWPSTVLDSIFLPFYNQIKCEWLKHRKVALWQAPWR